MQQPAADHQVRFEISMVLATMVIFLVALAVNELLFRWLEFVPGINWIFLPAGVRLLCTLLFGEAGVVGLLLVSWLVSFFWFFPNDPVRAFAGGILAAAAPWLSYRLVQAWYGLRPSLANLTPRRLLLCALVYSIASPLLHHIWFALHGDPVDLLRGFTVMFVGDLLGTLIVLYVAKALLMLASRRR
ncbi:MAG TPA: hypothetical protein VFT37_04735 [Telluria sp.]|nr:hypothetical protein [Telluria sp.]